MRQEVIRGASFGFALLWVAAGAAVVAATANVVSLWLIDFVHGNPHRPQSDAIEMMLTFTPVFAILNFMGIFVVFGVSQGFQALAWGTLARRLHMRVDVAALLTLPVAAILTWYSYDYLTPSNIDVNPDPDWRPYLHGITFPRYLAALAAQSLVTLFTFLYISSSAERRHRRLLIAIALLGALVAGGIHGRSLALAQFRFL